MSTKRKPHDGLFKNLLTEKRYVKAYLSLFDEYTSLVNAVDFTKEFTALNTDVNDIYVYTEHGQKRFADVVLLVPFLDGSKHILHFEAQSFYDDSFPFRMYQYNSRITERRQIPTLSFAICFKDYSQTAEAVYYEQDKFECNEIIFRFSQQHLLHMLRDDYFHTFNIAAIALSGLMQKGAICNFEFYLQSLKNLSSIHTSQQPLEVVEYEIALSFLHTYIELTKEERERIKKIVEQNKKQYLGGEEMAALVTLFNEQAVEEAVKEAEKETTIRELKASIYRVAEIALQHVENDGIAQGCMSTLRRKVEQMQDEKLLRHLQESLYNKLVLERRDIITAIEELSSRSYL